MEFPNSPFAVLSSMVSDFQEQRASADEFLAGLDNFEQYLNGWYQQVSMVPEQPDFPMGTQLKAATLESIQLFADALGPLRDYAETGEQEALDEGSSLANEAHELMLEAMTGARKTVDQLENELEDQRD